MLQGKSMQHAERGRASLAMQGWTTTHRRARSSQHQHNQANTKPSKYQTQSSSHSRSSGCRDRPRIVLNRHPCRAAIPDQHKFIGRDPRNNRRPTFIINSGARPSFDGLNAFAAPRHLFTLACLCSASNHNENCFKCLAQRSSTHHWESVRVRTGRVTPPQPHRACFW